MPSPAPARPLFEVAAIFLRLGATAFGGPAAHIALMEEELVRRRGWVTHAEFLDLLAATHLIPGPNSTELAIHLGHRRAGFPGLLLAGVCFILPSALLVSGIAWAYVSLGSLPRWEGLLRGVQPVIVAVILQALWALSRTALRGRRTWVLAALLLGAVASGVNELVILLGAGLAGFLTRPPAPRTGPEPPPPGRRGLLALPPTALWGLGATAAAVATRVPISLGTLFWIFLKTGSVLFGSGYVLLAFLRADLVERLGWLTESQLLDAIAVGQVTPGPVLTTSTFIGYLLAGGPGAAVATVGIFLPAFVLVALSGPFVPRLRNSPWAGAVLDGVGLGSLALMAHVTWALGRTALTELSAVLLFGVALLVLWRRKLNSTWLVLGGALFGLAWYG